MRLFIGIPLASEVTRQLAAYTEALKKPGDDLRWAAAESWHIKLQFLGSTTVEQYACVDAALGKIHARHFDVHLEGTGFFDRAGIFYVDVPPTAELTALQQKVLAATQPCGFEPEDRNYHPHITLARNKGRLQGLSRLKPHAGAAAMFASFVAQEFLLYESELGPGGARYQVRERYPLSTQR